jgi:hypothetical protein
MALNRATGEVSIELDGRAYTLVMDIKAITSFEALFSTPDHPQTFEALLSVCQKGSVRHICGLIWSAMRRHHKGVTFDEVTDLIDAAGGLKGIGDKFAALTQSMQPDKEDRKKKGEKERP